MQNSPFTHQDGLLLSTILAWTEAPGPLLSTCKGLYALKDDTYTQALWLVRQHPKSALYRASEKGHAEVVQLLLQVPEAAAGINAQDGYRRTALHCASEKGHVQVVQLLLQVLGSAAGINAQDGYDRTALQSASEKGHSEVVQMLLQVPGISI